MADNDWHPVERAKIAQLSEEVSEECGFAGYPATIRHCSTPLCQNPLRGLNARLLACEQMHLRQRFYLFKRAGMYYLQDGVTRRQQNLQTRDRTEAERLLNARNEATANPGLNLALARVYLAANDPKMLARTWQDAFDEFCSRGQPQTQDLRRRKVAHRAFALLRQGSAGHASAASSQCRPR